jgi:hypothetical protein
VTEPQKTKNEAFPSFFIIACVLAVLAYMREKLLEFSSMPIEIIALAILILMGISFITSLVSGKSGARGMPVLRSKDPIIYWLIILAYLVFFGFCSSQRRIDFKLFFSRTSDQVDNSQKHITEQQKTFQSQLKEDVVYVGQPVSNVRSRSSGNWRYIVLSNNGKASITNVSPSTPVSKVLMSPQYKGEYIIDGTNINIRGKDFFGETSLAGTIRKDSLSLRVDKHMGKVCDDPYFEYKRLQ